MIVRQLFPRRLVVCLSAVIAIIFFSSATSFAQESTSNAQTVQTRERLETAIGVAPRLEDEAILISVASTVDDVVPGLNSARMRQTEFENMLTAAIDTRLGAPYVWGSSGPRAFDCSGFVWSVFQSTGVNFTRVSARTLWSQFAPVGGTERYQKGTLVFFNNLTHVGIVADENGFYHASSSKGVTYSTFKGYWSSRIDGFRRVPAAQMLAKAE